MIKLTLFPSRKNTKFSEIPDLFTKYPNYFHFCDSFNKLELLTKVNGVFRLGKKLYFCTPKIINC